jgi:serine protease Do
VEDYFEPETEKATSTVYTRENLSELIEKLLPVVVSVRASNIIKSELKRYNSNYFYYNEIKSVNSIGSGFFISQDGYLLTNAHVVEDSDEVSIQYKNKDYVAELVGSDKISDIAVLKINSNEIFPFIELKKDTNLRIGENIVVIGNPYDLGVSVSYGIVSALNRNIKGTEYGNLIQTDAAINRGNSGSPMFDLSGNVVGITSVIFSDNGDNIGLGFAIPIADIIHIVEMLKVHGYVQRGYLGLDMAEVDNGVLDALSSKRARGILVLDVFHGSAAERGGILPSDVIISYDNKQIKNLNHLNYLIRNSSVGSTANVLVLRNGTVVNLKLKVDEFPYFKYDASLERVKNNSMEAFDMYLTAIDDDLINDMELHKNTRGMAVLDVKSRGIADLNGIERGDIILTVNQTQLKTKQDLVKALASIKNKANKEAILIVKKFKTKKNVLLRLNLGVINF